MANSVDFNSVLSLIDRGIKPNYLNPTQEIVLREVWNGQTYSKIALEHNYDPEYIKTVGSNLWKMLSNAFGVTINKSNFVPFMRQEINNFIFADDPDNLTKNDSQAKYVEKVSKSHCQWATAPNVKHFMGREKEVDLLTSWSEDQNCNCIVVSGMTGCGKTSLITKFAKSAKERFDCVIWWSLENPPSIITLIENFLNIFNEYSRKYRTIESDKSEDLNLLLSKLVNCLREKKILLVLDDLESILEIDGKSFHYKKQLESYGHFLRSIVSTNHQSLLVCASRVRPKLLEYYGTNQVKLLELQGFKKPIIDKLIAAKSYDGYEKQKLSSLAESLQNNPQLLQIADEHLELFDSDYSDIEQIVQELSLLEETIGLLEQELNCLSKLEQEIIFWLAMFNNPISRNYLLDQSPRFDSKIKLANSIRSLTMRTLITEHDSKYFLMPIMKSFLRRKLIAQAL